MRYYSYLFIVLIALTVTQKVMACDKESYITTPLPETPKMIVMDYPRSERAEIFAERVAAMRLWVASNE